MDEAGRLGVEQAADPQPLVDGSGICSRSQRRAAVRRDRPRKGAGRELPAVRRTLAGAWNSSSNSDCTSFCSGRCPPGQEHVPWSLTALILVIGRLCEPSSELHIAEHFYRHSALADLLGVPVDKVDDNRLYRGLDATAAAQSGAGEVSQATVRRVVRHRIRPAAVRRDQHVLRRTSQCQSLGEAWLLARSSLRLQTGLHRPGGDALRLAVGLRSVRGKSARFDHVGGDCRDDGSPLWPGATHLGVGSRHGLGRQLSTS